MKSIIIYLIIFISSIFAQTISYEKTLGEFKDASSFDIDLNGNIYISDRADNTIYKLDSLGQILTSIGGFGWNESLFDEPVSIFTNTLSAYVADKNNDRVQRFDKDLNFLSQYLGSSDNSDEIEFAYPTCVAIANIGDLYILDSDNGRILKYDLSGKYILEIGGNDAGDFAISNPKDFAIDNNENLYILDDTNIKVFDQYGSGLLKFKTIIEAKSISISENKLIFVNESNLTILDLENRKIVLEIDKLSKLENEQIVEAKLLDNFLFILTPRRILKFSILL
ncbi:MAG: 6-bladed beta-propeller [Melioribacteraceae bacterium]